MARVGDDYSEEMVESIYKLLMAKKFTDIKISCGEVKIECHLVVLATKSRYFEEEFFDECKPDEVNLDNLSNPRCLEKVIKYIYTNEIDIDDAELEDILKAGKKLSIDDLRSCCEKYIMNSVNINNCIRYLSLSKMYSLQKSIEFIESKFNMILKTEGHLDISYENMKTIISNQSLQEKHSDDILDYSMAWILHNENERKNHLYEILSLINLFSCRRDHLIQLKKDYNSLLDKECYELLFDVISDQYKQASVTMRAIVMGGLYVEDKNQQVFISAIGATMTKYHRLPPMTCPNASSICVYKNNRVMVTGGLTPLPEDKAVNTCKLFNLTNKTLEDKPSMIQSRYYHGSITVDGVLYVMGGYDDEDVIINSMECLTHSQWIMKAPMIHALWGPALTSHQQSIYVVGCTQSDNDVTQCYNTITNEWTLLRPPPSKAWCSKAVYLNDSIYICGGWNKACMKYLPSQDRWKKLNQSALEHICPSIMTHDGLIYLLGGIDSNDDPTDTIECYDPVRNQWTVMDWKLPIGLFDHFSFMLPL